MRGFRICSCGLFLVPLLGLLGCGSSAYVKKGPELKTNTVKIELTCNAIRIRCKSPKAIR